MQKLEIGRVALQNRRIILELGKTKSDERPWIAINKSPLHLVEIAEERLTELALPIRADFRLQASYSKLAVLGMDGQSSDVFVDAYENKLLDWAVEGGVTIQIKLAQLDSPYQVRVGPKIGIQLTEMHKDLEFRALVASHRLNGYLVATFTQSESLVSKSVEISLDQGVLGGKSPSGYKEVVVKSPVSGNCSVSLTLVCSESQSSDSESPPFLFLANPSLMAAVNSVEKVRQYIRNGALIKDATWYSASLPEYVDENGASISIEDDKKSIELLSLPSNRVHLIHNYGHALELKARVTQEMILMINRTFVDFVVIRDSGTFTAIPSQFLNGEIFNVALFDVSGTQIFFELPMIGKPISTPPEAIREYSKKPYPLELSVREGFRYRNLQAIFQSRKGTSLNPTLTNAIEALENGIEDPSLKPIAFPEYANPKVSVIVPVHNNVAVTYYCLCALLVAHNDVEFEVIVVDDGSEDETIELADLVSGVKFIRNEKPERFIRACNRGVAASRGEYVVLLNNDTEPTLGWLDELLNAFSSFPNVGLVGSKLLYPDGRLQDAGGIIWNSGNPWNYGNGDNPWHPKFSYTRQSDYLSGAAFMTKKTIWDEVAGLSSYLEPMYFEDTDFAFKVRSAGFRTYFVPSSIVYHYEGMTSGTDTSKGFKRFQEVNRPKFKQRWAPVFSKHGVEGQNSDLEKDRNIVGRVLFVDSGVPREDRDAGSYAARREIELVQSLGYKVTFLPQNLAHLGVYTDELAKSGVEVISAPFYRTLREFFAERGAEFDVVYMTRYYVAQAVLSLVEEFSPKAKTMLNNADLHFLRELRAAMNMNDPNRMIAMREVRDQELAVMKKVDLVLSYNEVEHAVIASHTDGAARVLDCPWVVKGPEIIPDLQNRSGISFLGSFRHKPNREGISWFCKSVMPLLSDKVLNLSIYGSDVDEEILDLASERIDVKGYIKDQADAFNASRVFIAPLLSGAGVKGKVLSALANGIPTVMTPIAAEGIGIRDGLEAIIAQTPEDWIAAINTLNEDDDLWRDMSTAASAFAVKHFSFEVGRTKMRRAFESVDLFRGDSQFN